MREWGLSEWLLAINCVNGVVTGCLAIVMIGLKSVFVTKRSFDDLALRVGNQSEQLTIGDSRMQRLDDRLDTMPSVDAVNLLNIGIEALKGEIHAVTVQLEGYHALHRTLERQVGVMDEFLLRERRR